MSPGQTTERIYDLLKAQIMGGLRRPGERLDPVRLAADLNASTTPVRDALHQLLGERLVEAWPREGFKMPVPTEAGLRDLYAWHGDLVELALRHRKSGHPPSPASPPAASIETPDGTRLLFTAIARAYGSGECQRAIDQVGQRLHSARVAETRLFADHAGELQALSEAWSLMRLADLRPLLARYHRRRHRQVPQIFAEMTAGWPHA